MTAPTPDWVAQLRALAEAATGLLGDTAGAPGEDHGAECRWCPVCTGLAVLRGRRPELTEALADVLSTAAAALRATVPPPAGPRTDSPADSPAGAPAGAPADARQAADQHAEVRAAAGEPSARPVRPAPPVAVQRIDVA